MERLYYLVFGFFTIIVIASTSHALSVAANVNNNTFATAQNLDAFFSVGPNSDIANAELTPWASVQGVGDGTLDFFSFSVAAASTGIFDIDYGRGADGSGIDTEIFLFDSVGNFLAGNDDSDITRGAGGSVSSLDAFLSYNFLSAGFYYLGVAEFNSFACGAGICGNVADAGDFYTLQLSVGGSRVQGDQGNPGQEVPEPGTLLLLSAGLLGAARLRKRHG